ncbi:MAG: fibronectin type III domain-containing protein [Nitrospira sp.]|nr:fibronectin type III domain-containing protein [Nitrospira sp.]MDH4371670.1 fibronectin type III domain-containing protein [Nitrospira sp.]
MENAWQTARSCRDNSYSALPWFLQVAVTAFICLGLASEGLATHRVSVTPTSLTYYAVQGASNPPSQTITVSRPYSSTATLTASDNRSWLTVSPATTSMTGSKTLTVAINTSGRGAGTYNATVTIKVGTWYTKTVPVTLVISPSTTPPPSSTSSATLTWNAVTGIPVSGYKVYVGEAPSQYTRTLTVGNTTSSTVNSLTVGRMYYFVVAAYNGAGEGPPSNMVSKTIQ